MLKYIGRYKGLLVGNISCSILVALFTVVSIPVLIPFLDVLFDQVEIPTKVVELNWSLEGIKDWGYYQFGHLIQTHGKQEALKYVCYILVAVFFLKNLFRYLALFFIVPIRNGVVRDIRKDLYQKTMHLPLDYFGKQKKGDLISRFSADTLEIEVSILNTLEVVVKSPLIIIGCIVFMLYVSPPLTVFVFILIAFTGFIIGGISKALKRSSRKAQERMGDLISTVDESIGGIKIIKAFSAESFMERHFSRVNNSYRKLLNKIIRRRDLSSPLSEFLSVSVVAVLIWYGSNLVFSESLETAVFFSFIFAFFNVIEPAKNFSKAYYNIQKGIAAADRVVQILDIPNEASEQVEQTIKFNDSIKITGLNFGYEAGNLILKNLNIHIPKGKTIAIVGSSGAGKTTVVDLLCRFYPISDNSILIDGVDINKLPIQGVRKLFAVVSQEPFVFHDSVYNNIAFGAEEVDQIEVYKAAKIAYAHDFISQLPEGYQTTVGDRGMRLSGGQRQRLTLARAILQNKPILILDEATSALDSESELWVQQAITEVAKSKTLIVIAHRLSTIKHADIIYVMDAGRIVETGSHNSLMENSIAYKKFVELQAF